MTTLVSIHGAGVIRARAKEIPASAECRAFSTFDLTAEDGTEVRYFIDDGDYAERLAYAVNTAANPVQGATVERAEELSEALSLLAQAVEVILPSPMTHGDVSGDVRDAWTAWKNARAVLDAHPADRAPDAAGEAA